MPEYKYTELPHDVRQLLEDNAALQSKLDAANHEIGRLQSELEHTKGERHCETCHYEDGSVLGRCSVCKHDNEEAGLDNWKPKRGDQ